MEKKKGRDLGQLLEENRKLRTALEDLQETFRAIRQDEVDALVVNTDTGDRVFTLKGADQSYRMLIEQMKEGAVMLSRDMTILYSNGGFAKMLNQPLQMLITSDVMKHVSETSKENFLNLVSEGHKNQGRVSKEITLKGRDGTLVPTLMSISNLGVNGTRATYIVITDLRQHMEDEVKTYTERLEREIKEKTDALRNTERLAAIGETAGMVGHDMRNPLQTIFGELYIAKEELKELPDSPPKQQMKEAMGRIEQQADYMNKIVTDLQDFAKPVNLEPRLIDVEKLIRETLKDIATPRRVNISIRVEKDSARIMIDPSIMKRILINLISNAVQAIQDAGDVGIDVTRENSHTVLSVKDTGVGIDEKAKSNLFRPLYTTKAKGQGFGLPVVKRLVEAQRGSISFVSERGTGTTFTIKIPLSNQDNKNDVSIQP